MSVTEFAIGQRWVSNSEAELGLGIIKELTGRRVEILFPAAGEQRTYATDIAPLSRVHYPVGEHVSTNEGVKFLISERHEFNGCFIYQGEDADGNDISIHEMDLDSHVQFSQPQDRLFAGQVDKNSQFELRIQALTHQHQIQQSSVFGLMGARVQLLPHQMYIAHEVATRHAPRVLLADEVGLGKTIEAGLIIHQQLISGRSDRVLVVVPDSLVHQWLVEMLRRFNLSFTIMDEERFDAVLEAEGTNPFESAQLVISSLSTLTGNQDIYQSAREADWDLMVVDEAHHLQWSENEVSAEYSAIEGLAQHVTGLLLLTATPEQLGIDSHFARLRLLDPDRYYDLEKFKEQEQQYQPVSELVTQLLSDDAQSYIQQNKADVIAYLGDEVVEQLLNEDNFESAQQQAISSLLDQHGTGRILFRNTRDAVAGFPTRHLNRYPLASPEGLASSDDLLSLIQSERLLGDDWVDTDPRIEWLVDWLAQHKTNKVLIICAQAETAQSLELFLRINKGLKTSVFHEGLSLVHRDRAAAYFADEDEGAQIMICSEIGSEGRNFQFSHHLVLFDLPLNPDLLEQRIGRLDRIGQLHNVELHVPYYQQSAQSVLLDWYHKGMNAFEQVFPAGSAIKQAVETDLIACLLNPSDEAALTKLITKTQALTSSTLETLQKGRNRLLELNSCNQAVATEVVEELEDSSNTSQLVHFMDVVFDEFGVDQQSHSADSVILEPGNHMLHHQFPGLPEDGVTATYKRHRALVREDMAFLSWEHPMVLGSLDLITNSDFGNSAFCTLATDELPAGTLLIEAIFKLHCPAPRSLQVGRYLTESYLRLVVDENGKEYSQLFEQNDFNLLAGRIPRATAQELIRHARPQITNLITQAKNKSTSTEKKMINAAINKLDKILDNEINRLTSLSKVNSNIRDEEITYLEDTKSMLKDTISNGKLSLDALRIAIATDPK